MKKICFLIVLLSLSCSKNETADDNKPIRDYSIFGSKILKKGTAIQLIGANALHAYGGNSNDMNAWNMDIVREFVGNMKEQPLSGNAIQDSHGVWWHPLQNVVNDNRLNNKITIICPFLWDGLSSTYFTGLRPSQSSFWNDYKVKLAQWAVYFKDQPDVWIEVWNEPYRWDRADGYTDALWTSDMNEMYAIVRNAGNLNIVLIPCCEQGQDESVLINVGANFLVGKSDVLFDIHAYEKWHTVSNSNVISRLDLLKSKNLPVFFGEVAPANTSLIMNPQFFLDNAYNRGMSICAWVWKYDQNDTDALLSNAGLPNDNNNNNWGTMYKTMAARVRVP